MIVPAEADGSGAASFRPELDRGAVADLAGRLAATRLAAHGAGTWERGVPGDWLAGLIADWNQRCHPRGI